MTNQEAFDRVVTHLRLQGRQSGNGRTCYYRSPDGLRCAVGVLITDEFYMPGMEGRSVSDPLLVSRVVSRALPGVSKDLLYELQIVHDSKWEQRERCWDAIAQAFGLIMPPFPIKPTIHEAEHALA